MCFIGKLAATIVCVQMSLICDLKGMLIAIMYVYLTVVNLHIRNAGYSNDICVQLSLMCLQGTPVLRMIFCPIVVNVVARKAGCYNYVCIQLLFMC